MGKDKRTSVSLPDDLVKRMDAWMIRVGLKNDSEAIRRLIAAGSGCRERNAAEVI
jgi:metal-responsive CopG/Arc/MetJ family transcriptional regulator